MLKGTSRDMKVLSSSYESAQYNILQDVSPRYYFREPVKDNTLTYFRMKYRLNELLPEEARFSRGGPYIERGNEINNTRWLLNSSIADWDKINTKGLTQYLSSVSHGPLYSTSIEFRTFAFSFLQVYEDITAEAEYGEILLIDLAELYERFPSFEELPREEKLKRLDKIPWFPDEYEITRVTEDLYSY